MIGEISTLLWEMLLGLFGGNYYLLGGFALFVFMVIGVVMRLSLDAFLVVMTPLLWLLSKYGFLPGFIEYLSYIVLAIIIAFGIWRMVRR